MIKGGRLDQKIQVLHPVCAGEDYVMWNKEPLSRVTEYKPSGRSAPATSVRATGDDPVEQPASAQAGTAAPPLDPTTLKNALNNLSTHVQNLQRSLQFTVDKDSGDTVVTIVDSETHKVVRQIPSEELLAIAHRLRSAVGVLVTEKV